MISTFIKSDQGFSLIEVIVAMLIFTIVTSGFALIFTSATRSNKMTEETANSIRESVSSIDRALAEFIDGGSRLEDIPEEMIIADPNAEINITINGQEINLSGYIVEGSGDANNKAFFPESLN